MKLFRSQSLWWLVTLVSYGSAITLLQALATYPQLSSYNALLSNSSSATALLASSNNFTFLAPSNDAIATFNTQNPGVLNGSSMLANVQYGLLKGGYPSLSFTTTPQFVASNLTNTTYANVTGGQVVELVRGSDGTPQVLSGNKTISTSTSADIICVGGIIHIINSVLSIPVATVLEITNANLQYFISILSTAGYLSASATYVNAVLEVPDVTFFVPNSASALSNVTVLSQNSSAQELQAIFQYHIVPGFVGYSTKLTNGMSLKTQQGSNLTITLQDGDMYVNSAKVIESDLLVANGVVHVLDNMLNRFDTSGPPAPVSSSTTSTTQTPTFTPTAAANPSPTKASSSSKGLSTGAKAGIGIGVAVFAIGLSSLLLCIVLRHRRKQQNAPPWDNSSMSGVTSSPSKFYVQRGTVQRKEDPGLGLQSTAMQHVEEGGGNRYGDEIGGPRIPPRSPSRALRGNGDGYF